MLLDEEMGEDPEEAGHSLVTVLKTKWCWGTISVTVADHFYGILVQMNRVTI